MALSALTLVSLVFLAIPTMPALGQTQVVTATPGTINLGFTTSIAVTAPAAGTYTVVVQKPNGATTSMNYVFTAAGQTENETFGSATLGFTTVVNAVGTYNVFVEQGSTVVGTTSFYVTNRLVISMDMVTGGTCAFINGEARGYKFFPRFYVTYASDNSPITNNVTGIYVTYNYPDGTLVNASWHRPTAAAPDQGGSGGNTGFYIGKFQPGWNYTTLGPWVPTASVGDAFGNVGTYTWTGPAFDLVAATFAQAVTLTDAGTNLPIATLYNGERVNINATITYPTNPETVSGFAGPLDSAVHGGVVSALIGWGDWNASTGTFGGGGPNSGALLETVPLTYSGANGTWTGQFTATSLPTLPAGQSYAVAIVSSDKASPPNTGLTVADLSPAPTPASVATTTVTAVSSTTVTQPGGAGTTTSVSTTLSTVTSTLSQVVQSIPTTVYAGLAIILVLGLIIGMIVRLPRRG